jgi:chromosomal replication initiation ATPase DnaA
MIKPSPQTRIAMDEAVAAACIALKEVKLEPEFIKSKVAAYFHVDVPAMLQKRRTATLTWMRFVSFYLCRKYCRLSFPEIARRHGFGDHATVVNGIRTFNALIETDPSKRTEFEAVRASLFNTMIKI